MASKTPRKSPKKKPVAVDRYGDPLPPGALMRLGSDRLLVHPRPTAVAFSPDGKLLATGNDLYGQVDLWDAQTGSHVTRVSKVQRVLGHLNGAKDITFSADGKWLAMLGSSVVRVWDLAGNIERITRAVDYGHRLAFSLDSRLVAVARGRFPIYLYSTASATLIREIEGPDWCEDIAFSSDGALLAAAGIGRNDEREPLVQLIDVHTGKVRLELRPDVPLMKRDGYYFRSGIRFSTDGRILAVLFPDEALYFYEIPSGARTERRPLPRLFAPWKGWPTLRFSGDLSSVAAFTWSEPARVHATDTGAQVFAIPGSFAADFSPDGRVLAAADSDSIRLWSVRGGDRPAGAEVLPFERHRGIVGELWFAPDGRRLFSRGVADRLLCWDLESGALIWDREGPYRTLSHDARLGVITRPSGDNNNNNNVLSVINLETEEVVTELSGAARYNLVQISQDGGRVYANEERVIRSWSAKGGEVLGEIGGHVHAPYAFAVGPGGDLLASASWEDAIRLWSVGGAAPKLVRSFRGRSYCYCSMVFSPDGARLASGCRDHAVRIWDVASGELIHVLKGHSRALMATVLSPDGALLASADELSFRIWDAKTGAQLCIQRIGATALRFSPNGRILVSGHLGTSHLWSVEQLLARA